MKIVEATIEELKKSNHFRGEEISRLERDLSMTKIHKSIAGVRFGHAKKAYKIGFEECRALTIQMLPSDKA